MGGYGSAGIHNEFPSGMGMDRGRGTSQADVAGEEDGLVGPCALAVMTVLAMRSADVPTS